MFAPLARLVLASLFSRPVPCLPHRSSVLCVAGVCCRCQTYNLSPNLPNHKLVPPFPATGETVVLTLGLRLNEFQEDIIALCAYLVFFTSCVYFILKFLVKEER